MPRTLAVTTRYRYVPGAMRYRDNRTGRYVAASTVKRATQTVVRKARAEMRRLADDLDARRITLANWQRSFAAELKLLHVSMAMVGAGGLAAMTLADYGRVGQRLRFEYERLNVFARQLKDRQFTRKAFVARVEMYVNAGQVSCEAARAGAAETAGMEEERNVLGPRENHCETGNGRVGCRNLTAQGWQPLGTIPPVGHRKCLSNCGCTMAFRKRKRPG